MHHLESNDGRANQGIVCFVAVLTTGFMAIWRWDSMGQLHMGIQIIIIHLLLHVLWLLARVSIPRSLRGLILISLPCRPTSPATVWGCNHGRVFENGIFTQEEPLHSGRRQQMLYDFAASQTDNSNFISRWNTDDNNTGASVSSDLGWSDSQLPCGGCSQDSPAPNVDGCYDR